MVARSPKNKNSRKFFRKMIFPAVLLIFISAAIIFFMVSNIELYQKKMKISTKVASLEKDAQRLDEINEELKSQVSQGQTETFVEKEARGKLNLKKPGENVVVVLPPKEAPQTQEKKNLWQKFLARLGF